MANHQEERLLRLKKKKKRKVITLILLPVFIFVLAVAGYGTHLYLKADQIVSDSYVEDDREHSTLRETKIDPHIDNVSVLILGVDASENRDNAENSRTDALMVATFNKEADSIKLVSIPRDSLVYIPALDYEDKINHAHAYGGPSATIKTVENLLDIPIDYYIRLNFHAFVDVVDALGGIQIAVPYDVNEPDSMDNRDSIQLYEGYQTLDGEEALALARTRRMDNDIERGKRQQEIVQAIIKQATSVSSILRYDNLLQAVGDNMTTNMSFNDIRTFISYGTNRSNFSIETMTLNGTDYQPANVYYWDIDEESLEETKTILQDHLEITTNPTKDFKTTPTYHKESNTKLTVEKNPYREGNSNYYNENQND